MDRAMLQPANDMHHFCSNLIGQNDSRGCSQLQRRQEVQPTMGSGGGEPGLSGEYQDCLPHTALH